MPDSSRIEIFSDKRNLYRRVTLRRGLLAAALAAVALTAAGNAWWLAVSSVQPEKEAELADHARASAMRAQALERAEAITSDLDAGLERLRQGDARIREMISLGSLDKEARKAAQGVDSQAPAPKDRQAAVERMEVQAAFSRALDRPVRLSTIDGRVLHAMLGPGPSPLGSAPDAWPAKGALSSEFGVRLSPFAGQEEFHKGVDIMAPDGTPVRSPAPGTATFAGLDAEGTQAVVLDHGGGYATAFSHMSRADVKPGERVERGQVIGAVGHQGRSTGPHLHYEVRLHGVPVDPRKFLP